MEILSDHDFDGNGFAIVGGVLSEQMCVRVAASMQCQPTAARCLLAQNWCATLARALKKDVRLAAILGPDPVAVQCTYFEKSADRNWLVPLHQDLSIPVAERVDSEALAGWSVKDGVQFVRAPVAVLAQLTAVRIHLDVCGPDDGPLRVVPGSHCHGIVDESQIDAWRAHHGVVACHAGIGDALALRPLLLHASSKGTGTGLRRVLHFVFGPRELPHGLAWAWRV